MKGMTKFAFVATLVVALSLAMLLTLLLFLLINLFCSLLCNKTNKKESSIESLEQSSRPLSLPFYGHGVLQAPKELLLSVPNLSFSNPIYNAEAMPENADIDTDTDADTDTDGDVIEECSPPLKMMKKLPLVIPRGSFGASTETNRQSNSSSFSDSLWSSPSW